MQKGSNVNDLPTFRITQPLPEVRDRLRAELEFVIEDDGEILTTLVDTVVMTLTDLHDEDNLDPADR